jgi:hypothetical protein
MNKSTSRLAAHRKQYDVAFESLQSRLTPRITRRPERLNAFNNLRVGGRVHAVVMLPID